MSTTAERHRIESNDPLGPPRLALVLGGGAARGLAHIGVIEVLAREGIAIDFIAGSSMGGLIGALCAKGLSAADIATAAAGFRFPRYFIPGGVLPWERLFASSVPWLSGDFDDLEIPLAVSAVDLEAGAQIVLHSGSVLSAVQATCSVPGVLAPVRVNDRWLVDGALMNSLPVDLAWMSAPDLVIAVKVGGAHERRMPSLDWRSTSHLAGIGGFLPNPATGRMTFEVLARAIEIMLERQAELSAAITAPEVLIEPELGDMGLRDFDRLDHAISAGRKAAEAALPDLIQRLESLPSKPPTGERDLRLRLDPVCSMVMDPTRAKATTIYENRAYYFCSENCQETFEFTPQAFLGRTLGAES